MPLDKLILQCVILLSVSKQFRSAILSIAEHNMAEGFLRRHTFKMFYVHASRGVEIHNLIKVARF